MEGFRKGPSGSGKSRVGDQGAEGVCALQETAWGTQNDKK